jgi:hypothetical protein
MPFRRQRLHTAAFNDVLIYRRLCIDCAVLCIDVFNWQRGLFGVPSSQQ